MSYTFHSDPGHGWLEVERKELKRLGIDSKISHYSYQKGDTVFLEEDCDAPIFIKAKKAAGEEYNYTEETSNNNSFVRDCEPYCSY